MLWVRQSKQFLEPPPFLSILYKTSGNFLIYDFLTPHLSILYMDFTCNSLTRPNITPGPYLTWHRYFCDVSSVENEFRKIKQVDWYSENLEEVKFWSKELKYEVQGEKTFLVLSSYALACLCLPVSNAYVEQIFSIVSWQVCH